MSLAQLSPFWGNVLIVSHAAVFVLGWCLCRWREKGRLRRMLERSGSAFAPRV